ncbi:MAG TPA: VOC family protein [Mycobacteriales bacterium]|jgi:hypothetical protein|nr:VOC family protein [Mycobacteriales bacterium]
MSAMSQGRRVIEVLERSYRDAEDSTRRPERVPGEVPEPTDVDARAADQASIELLALGLVAGPWEDWLRISCFPYLRQFPGVDRSVGQGWVINDHLDAAEEIALTSGGNKLQDKGAYRTYADPLGHPLCLYLDATVESGTLARIVIDCPDPFTLATFYGQLLRMPQHIEDSADRIVIARDVDTFPMLAFQRVDYYVAPRWPDPAYPAQMHFDVVFDDRAAAERRATELGATWLRPQHDEHFGHVYADPAGHPFCLLEPGD